MNIEELYSKLVQILEDEVGIYRHLLEMVRGEKDVLIAADLDAITENNRAKEMMITKLRVLERARQAVVGELLPQLKMPEAQPRLLDLAVKLGGDKGEKLRTIHSTLDLMIKRIREYNEQNEKLIQSALKTFEGSMNALRNNLAENKTYKRKGQASAVEATAQSGQFISKEA
ncbi:MAG TPA: flagellar protein FlgN [Bdellovibrionales bacterium]|nr:flagellar protein FlgN [Bdellovibrionales bacterium]